MSYIMKTPMNANRYIPVVRVSFHTEKACYRVFGKARVEGEPIDPTNQVISVSTQKTLSAPAGSFSIQLVGDEWIEKLKPNDLVVISMGYKGITEKASALNTIMVGLIDSVRLFRTVGDGQPMVNTTITGRDFGKIFLKAMLRFYPEIGNASNRKGQKFFLTEEGWITLLGFFTNENIMKGTPAVILDNIIRLVLQKIVDVRWTVWDETKKIPTPKKVNIGNILRYSLGKVDMFMPMILAADQFEGPLWNLMERASIKPFTELFIDVRTSSERLIPETIEQSSSPDKAKIAGGDIMKGAYPFPAFIFGDDHAKVLVVFRNTPFDKPLWDKLFANKLDPVDIIEEDLSFSDNEHYNLFWAGTVINPFGMDLKRVAPPLLNENEAKRYGLSPLEVQIEGLSIEQSNDGHKTLLEGLSKSFSAKLKAWFEKNHEYLSGTLTVRGKGSYKIGQRLIREDIRREFYIEGVSQNFNMYESWTTTLEVTRGMRIGSIPDHTRYLEKPKKPVSQKTTKEIRYEYYTVKRGDTLWDIAAKKEIYGDAKKWTKIWEANKQMLIQRDKRNATDPGHWIYPGQILRIPR